MSKCINVKTPEFESLSKKFKSNIKAYTAVSSWQEANNSSEIPTYTQIRDMYKVQEFLLKEDLTQFKKQLIGNLEVLGLVKQVQDVVLIEGNRDIAKENTRRINNYLYINNIPTNIISIKNIRGKNLYKVSIDTSQLKRVDIIPKTRSNDSNKTKAVIDHLQTVFPQVKVVKKLSWEAKEDYLNIPENQRANVDYSEVKSFYDPATMTSYILTDRVTDETAIEEILHPFVDALKADNNKLYKSLLKEARRSFPILKSEIAEDYTDERGFNQDIRDIELVTQALSRHFNTEFEKNPTSSFVDKIKQFLQWFYDTIIKTLYKRITGKPLTELKQDKTPKEKLEDIQIVFEDEIVNPKFNIDKKYRGKIIFASSGIGKSFAQSLNDRLIDSDSIYASLLGVSVAEMLPKIVSLSYKEKLKIQKQLKEELIKFANQGYTVLTPSEFLLKEGVVDMAFIQSDPEQMALNTRNEDRENPYDQTIVEAKTRINRYRKNLRIAGIKPTMLKQGEYISDYLFLDKKPEETLAKSANLELNKKLVNFLSEFGISIREIEDIQKALNIDALGFVDIINKVGYMDKSTDEQLPYIAGRFIAEMMQYQDAVSDIYKELRNVFGGATKIELLDQIGQAIGDRFLGKELNQVALAQRSKVIEFIKKIIGLFFEAIGQLDYKMINANVGYIVENVLENNTNLITSSKYKPGAEGKPVSRVFFRPALKKDKFAGLIVEQFAEKGFILTGSVTAAEQGTILRPSENQVHDLDWVSPFNRKDTRQKLKELYPEASFIREIINEDYLTDTFIIAPEGYEIQDLEIVGDRNTVISYNVVEKSTGKIRGTYKLVDKKEVINENMPDGVEAKIIDFFVYNGQTEETQTDLFFTLPSGTKLRIAEFQKTFRAKMSWKRLKDIWDYNRYIPYEKYRKLLENSTEYNTIEKEKQQEKQAKLVVDQINPTMSLSDVAKMLNTSDIEFKLKPAVDSKIKYSLSPKRKTIINQTKSRANDIQKKVIDKITEVSALSGKETDQISVAQRNEDLVVFDEELKKFVNLNTGEEYKSISQDIFGTQAELETEDIRLALGDDLDNIIEAAVFGTQSFETLQFKNISNEIAPGENVSPAKRLYLYFRNAMSNINSDSVIIPNVVVSDQVAGIADKIDLVIIGKDGTFKLVNFSLISMDKLDELNTPKNTAKDSALSQDNPTVTEQVLLNVRLQVQKRLLEKVLGTKAISGDNNTLTSYVTAVNFKDGVIQEGIETRSELTYQSSDVDKADSIYQNEDYEGLNIDDDTFYDPLTDEFNNFEASEQTTQQLDDMADIDTITRGLNNFKRGLLSRQEALEKINSSIFVESSREDALQDIHQALSAINIAISSKSLQQLNSTYSYFLRKSNNDVKNFINYLEDPKNFASENYITYALNAKRFAITYQGLYSMESATNLNKSLKALTNDLQANLNKLQGNVEPSKMNVSDRAILSHVTSLIKTTTSQDLTDKDLENIMAYAQDITKSEYLTRDLATSRDVILRAMNKIYHNKKMQVLDVVQGFESRIRQVSSKLYKLSSEKDRQKLFLFMANPDGTYLNKIGQKYWQKYDELKSKLYVDGNPLEFVQIDDLNTADPEDIKYNKKLAADKRAFSDFLNPEIIDENNMPVDGPNRRLTKEFKLIRDKYEVLNPNDGRYARKPNISDEDWARYRITYFNEKTYLRADKDAYGNYTGRTIETTQEFLKSRTRNIKIVEIRETNAQGVSYLDERYTKLMNPTTALERAQLEFYQMYNEIFNEMLRILPTNVRNQMEGRIPLIANKLLKNTQDKSNMVTTLFAKMSNGVKSFFEDTVEQRSVTINEEGELVDTLPIFYVGRPRDEEKLKEIENKIEVLQNRYRKDEINRDQYESQIAVLRGQRNKIRSKPAKGEISLDLGSNLMKFVGMAQHFSIMSQAEDSLNAMVKLIETRKYAPAPTMGAKLGKFIKGEFKEQSAIKGKDTNTFRRARAFMNMIFYDNERANKGTLDKVVDGVLQYTSLAYVGFNPFGSFNNYAFARISNYIEVLGGSRYFERKAYLRAEKEFNKYALPGFMNRMSSAAKNVSGKYFYDPERAGNKYEALVDFFRMMDEKGELREQTVDFDQKSFFRKGADLAYYLQDIGEYNVQTKVGMAVLMSTYIKNSKTGQVISLYDAFDFDAGSKEVKLKQGFDIIVEKNKATGKWMEKGEYSDTFRYNIRSKIREVNKQIHGNYARDDRMVIQSTTVGKLAAQFHKWVAPAINARLQKEYYDENLGWMEGRYRSFLRFLKDSFRQVYQGNLDFTSYNQKFKEAYGFKGDGSQADQKITNRLQGFYRTTAELTIIGLVFMLKTVLTSAFSEDDDDDLDPEVKRFRNFLRYQTDRTYKDMVLFIPIIPSGLEQIYQMFKSPIASTRTLGDMGRALSNSVSTTFGYVFREDDESFWSNKDYVYQRGARKGQMKVDKYWKDVVPLLRTIQKYTDFLTMNNYYIK